MATNNKTSLYAVEYCDSDGKRQRVEVPADDHAAALCVVVDEQDDIGDGSAMTVTPVARQRSFGGRVVPIRGDHK